jgi:hypothetical protein
MAGNNNIDKVSNNLFILAGEEDVKTPYDWDDMPEFVQDDNEAYAVIKVRIRNEEDLRAFAKLIDQPNVTSKTRGVWYPALDRNANSLLFWMDEEN